MQADSDGGNPVNQASDGGVPPKAVKDKNRGTNTRGNPELELRNVKCFGCHKKGHVVSECPDKKNRDSSRVIQADQDIPTITTETVTPDPWIRVLTATKEDNVADDKVIKLVGPTFKVDVEVEGVKTRALVDNGSQVTLVRGELLPKIREHNGWTLGQCHQKNRPMETQPIGASGQDLGASSVVAIETRIEQTGRKLVIPCFVMTSAKPIWQGNVKDCAMVLGTNALVEFGFQLVHTD